MKNENNKTAPETLPASKGENTGERFTGKVENVVSEVERLAKLLKEAKDAAKKAKEEIKRLAAEAKEAKKANKKTRYSIFAAIMFSCKTAPKTPETIYKAMHENYGSGSEIEAKYKAIHGFTYLEELGLLSVNAETKEITYLGPLPVTEAK